MSGTRFRPALALMALGTLLIPFGVARAEGPATCVVNYVLGELEQITLTPAFSTTGTDDPMACVDAAGQAVDDGVQLALDEVGRVASLVGSVATELVTIVNGVVEESQYFAGIPDQIPLFIGGDALADLSRCGGGPVGCTVGGEQNPAQWSFSWRMRVYTSGGRDMYHFGQYYEWAGSGGRVTYLWTDCYDYGGFYEYEGCKYDHTPTGTRSSEVQGHWEYRCCFTSNGVSYPKRPHAEATVHADSTLQGTVYTG